MDFTPRMKQILIIMLKKDRTMSVQSLAEQVGVSKRTVQRELEYINASLKGTGVVFMSKTGAGIWLEGSDGDKKALYAALTKGDSFDAGNREERRKRLILEILKDKGLKKLFYYSSKFRVSEATISTDLEAVAGWLECHDLHVERRPGSGVSIEGSEESYRKAIRAFIDENIDTDVLREAYENTDGTEDSDEERRQSGIGQILNDDTLKRVTGCIMEMKDARVMNLTENSYVGLVLHVTIAINRILKNEIIETDAQWGKNLQGDEDYALAERIVRELEKEFDIEIPPIEVSYICLHIKGAKHEKIQWDDRKTVAMENREMQQIINEMIDTFDEENAWLLKQDEEFIQGLLAHLQPTFVRLRYGMQITNPVLDTIKQDYPDIFARCILVSKVLERWLKREVPEAETGFLAVHFGAAMVRLEGKREDIRQVQIGVVCSSGIGISRLMSSKLEKAFKDRAVFTIYGKKDITPYVAGKLDFFVSSIPLEPQEIPVIFVNPLLNEKDMAQVRELVYQYARTPKKQKEENSFSAQLEEINLVAAQINAVIKYFEFFKVDNYISFDELLIAIGEKLSPYRDRGIMIQEDLRRREKLASQIFAEFGFALLHTRSRGVIRPSFTVCMTKDLQSFKDPYFKEIKIIFIMLVPVDENLRINSEILGYISAMLIEDSTFLDTVLTGDKKAMQALISAHLKKFFNKYLTRL